ncbi:MAG TPA: transketolase C-terminal domain-containing protein [Candidatus Micrarchaeia archaeon]|nr:transketolase C-terminal domain-containing protein [Candidatus Micrarchaeia archaeon]
MTRMTMVEALRDGLRVAMAADPTVICLGLDIGRLGGVFRVTKGLQQEFGMDRVVDTPLAEAAIIGAAIGLAVSGLRPVAELQFLGFSHQGFHQIGAELGRFRQRSRGRFSVPVVIRAPCGGGIRSPEFHSDSLEAQFVQMPGIKVVMPACPADAKGLLLTAIRDPDPVLFCEPDRLYRSAREEVPAGDHAVPFGVARQARRGTDVTLIAWSAAVELCLRAAEALAAEEISAQVLDLRTLVPLDTEAVVAAARDTGRVVVVHEAPLTAGFGAEIAATIQEEAFASLDGPVRRVAAWDVPYPPGRMEDTYLPSVARVTAAARAAVLD